MVQVSGNEVIQVELTLDQVTFIISGLRDQASNLTKLIDGAETAEVEQDFRKIRLENLHLANYLESTYMNQQGGK